MYLYRNSAELGNVTGEIFTAPAASHGLRVLMKERVLRLPLAPLLCRNPGRSRRAYRV